MTCHNAANSPPTPDVEIDVLVGKNGSHGCHSWDLFGSQQEDFVMRTPWPVLSLTALYLYFVLVFGPAFMKSKKPMTLKSTILVYNAAQVAFSFWWFYETVRAVSSFGWKEAFYVAGGCMAPSPQFQYKVNVMGYWYLISKFVELLDTIFFVLRGKQNQVTFLHVYHHSNMAVSTWFFMKNNVGTQSMMLGTCNTFVHVVMYAYYLLAALGPQVRRHLWWKRYITVLQITQFLVILGYLGMLQLFGCAVPTAFVSFSTANTISFLVLFLHFYVQAYRLKNKAAANKRAADVIGPSDKPVPNGTPLRNKEIKAE